MNARREMVLGQSGHGHGLRRRGESAFDEHVPLTRSRALSVPRTRVSLTPEAQLAFLRSALVPTQPAPPQVQVIVLRDERPGPVPAAPAYMAPYRETGISRRGRNDDRDSTMFGCYMMTLLGLGGFALGMISGTQVGKMVGRSSRGEVCSAPRRADDDDCDMDLGLIGKLWPK